MKLIIAATPSKRITRRTTADSHLPHRLLSYWEIRKDKDPRRVVEEYIRIETSKDDLGDFQRGNFRHSNRSPRGSMTKGQTYTPRDVTKGDDNA